MKDKAAHACHALCRARVVEEIQRHKRTRIAALLPHDRRCRRHIVGGDARRLAGGTSKQAAKGHSEKTSAADY